MGTANPFPKSFEDFGPIDAAYLAQLPPELRAQFEESEQRFARAEVQAVPHAEIEAALDRKRLEAMKAG